MRIEITPLDTLFFRDGKPFTMGENIRGNGIFPPYPSAIYGGLRSLYFAYNSAEIKEAGKEQDPTAKTVIKGIYLKRYEDILFPAPLDLAENKEKAENQNKGKKAVKLSVGEKEGIGNIATEKILHSGENLLKQSRDKWLNDLNMKRYLADSSDGIVYTETDENIFSEPKIGIKRDRNTHTTEEGMLYKIDMLRLKDLSIVVDFEGLNIPEKSGLMKFGGEGRPFEFKLSDSTSTPDIDMEEEKNIKLYLSTPAIFGGGWLPEWINEDSLEGDINGIKLRLVTAAIGKPLHIGGWDMANGRPKAMRLAVPAGSVYYFELLKKYPPEELKEALHGKAISDSSKDRREGFGITFVGRWR